MRRIGRVDRRVTPHLGGTSLASTRDSSGPTRPSIIVPVAAIIADWPRQDRHAHRGLGGLVRSRAARPGIAEKAGEVAAALAAGIVDLQLWCPLSRRALRTKPAGRDPT